MIQLSLLEFRNLIDTDEDLYEQRAWLLRNTSAAGECTVIHPHHAAAIRAADPDGAVLHIQTYTLADGSEVHTAWHPMAWRESRERQRLHKIANSTWREEHAKKGRCFDIIDDFMRKLHFTFGFKPADFAPRFLSVAESSNFSEDVVLNYINQIDKEYQVSHFYEAIQKIKNADR